MMNSNTWSDVLGNEVTAAEAYRLKVKRLVNFSHPLNEAARARLEEMVGPVQEIVIPCQLDMEAPLRAQLDARVAQAGCTC